MAGHVMASGRKCDIFTAYMATPKLNPIIVSLEAHTGLGPTFAARLLGLPYVSYTQYKTGKRELKDVHIRHIELVMFLDPDQLQEWITRHAGIDKA